VIVHSEGLLLMGGEMVRSIHRMIIGIGLLGIWVGCGGRTTTCSTKADADIVELEAGAEGLPDVGESCSRELCMAICKNLYSACIRTKELTVTCEPGKCQ
jgi:hypothetical protein